MIKQIQTTGKSCVMIQGDTFYLEVDVAPEIWDALDAIQHLIGVVKD